MAKEYVSFPDALGIGFGNTGPDGFQKLQARVQRHVAQQHDRVGLECQPQRVDIHCGKGVLQCGPALLMEVTDHPDAPAVSATVEKRPAVGDKIEIAVDIHHLHTLGHPPGSLAYWRCDQLTSAGMEGFNNNIEALTCNKLRI